MILYFIATFCRHCSDLTVTKSSLILNCCTIDYSGVTPKERCRFSEVDDSSFKQKKTGDFTWKWCHPVTATALKPISSSLDGSQSNRWHHWNGSCLYVHPKPRVVYQISFWITVPPLHFVHSTQQQPFSITKYVLTRLFEFVLPVQREFRLNTLRSFGHIRLQLVYAYST